MKPIKLILKLQGVDFSNEGPFKEPVPEQLLGELSREENLVLKIFYPPGCYLGERISKHIENSSRSFFGSHLIVVEVLNEPTVTFLDFSKTKIWEFSFDWGTGPSSHLYLVLDHCRVEWKSEMNETRGGKFYLPDSAYRAISPFYSTMIQENNSFKFLRMSDMEFKFNMENFVFMPTFQFTYKSSKDLQTDTITKRPLLEFEIPEESSCDEAMDMGMRALTLFSFYYSIDLSFETVYLHLKENSVTYLFSSSGSGLVNRSGAFHTENLIFHRRIDWFLRDCVGNSEQVDWGKITTAIKLLNQSHLVANRSKLLIRYSILELFVRSQTGSNFRFSGSKKDVKEAYAMALEVLLKIIPFEDHISFQKRWNDVRPKLESKPGKDGIFQLFTETGLDISKYQFGLGKIKAIRNELVHGSKSSNEEEIIEANEILFELCVFLILKSLGVASHIHKFETS